MTFTSAQRDTIRKLLCAPKRFLDSALLPYPHTYPLEERIQVIESDADTTALVVSTLAEIATIETAIAGMMSFTHAKSVEGININPSAGIRLLRQQGRIKIGVIANALDLKPRGDYFSPVRTVSSTYWS